ncbi:F-box protein At5g03100-like [Rutidosis leptorrhynchoides]|uniref:F-box protein At5g03100-like n=1 Tax=Rutidosis leptorrhynchoides TaxID=125765 RepID=UPI003A98FBBE
MMEVKEEEEDRLSALWDSIILEILMHLPYTQTQCAIKTLTLSKRWLHLWTDYFNIKYHNPISSIWPSAFPGFEYVAETLIQCRRSNLAKFHITGNYSDLLQPHVNNWIRYAVNCEVKDLDIIFNNTEYVLEDFFFINSCFTRLNLFGCVFNPTGAISWNKLTRLSLSHTELDEDMIENILSGCPVLETFELGYCNGYTLLDITSKSVKNLVITGYGDPEADEYPDIVKINAPYISSLTIGGSLLVWNILLLNVSSLIEGNLNFIKCENSETSDEDMFGLTICLLHAKKLNIGILCNKVFSRLEARGFSFPSNLKVLDSEDEANSLIWHGSYGDSLNTIEEEEDWKCFHTRVRSASSLDGRITVKLLEDETKVKDRISALPDGLLIEILSRLPKTKYAIRTSTLSKRWRHIWTYIPTLIFKRGYGDDFSTSDFFMSVDQTLAQCRHLKLNKFELHCCRGYDIQFESRVKDWIHHVITLNVEELYLDLFNRGLEAEFVLDEFFYTNSCITKMTLQGCIFTPTGAIL